VPRYPGEEIARGSRSSVRAWGTDAVAKVPLPTTPDAWIVFEARYTAAVHAIGAPVPRLLGIEHVNGRAVSIFERVWGGSMWEQVATDPSTAAAAGTELAELHERLLNLIPPPTLPRQLDRIACKVRRAASLVAAELGEALEALPSDVTEYRLCHGDLHPANVIVTSDGPVVIDWFDASRGDSLLDIARTLVLLGDIGTETYCPPHQPGATVTVLRELHEAYRARILRTTELSVAELDRRRMFALAARLAEGLERDDLLRAWRSAKSAHLELDQ
jgi:aminoglycoside phosphotransferase (APT) family kinase protein